MYYIMPTAATPMDIIYFVGYLNIYSTTEIEIMKTSQFICDRTNLEDIDLRYWNFGYINCRAAPELTAGRYGSLFHKKLVGYAAKRYDMISYNLYDDTPYEFKAVSRIDSLNSNIGSPLGQILTISGVGFSLFKDKVKVTAAGRNCKIISSNLYKIVCKVEKGSENKSTVGHSGLEWHQFDMGKNYYNPTQLKEGIIDKGLYSQLNVIDKKIILEMQYIDQNKRDKLGEWFRGWIKAPRTGSYKFHIVSSSDFQVYLSKEANNPNRTHLQKIIDFKGYANFKDFLQAQEKQIQTTSETLSLVKDNYYLFEGYKSHWSWHPHFSMAVEIASDTVRANSVAEIQEIKISYQGVNENMIIKLYQVSKGGWKMLLNKKWSGVLKWDASESDVAKAFNDNLKVGAHPKVVRSGLDKNGNPTTNTSEINGYLWNITFVRYRGETVGKSPYIKGEDLDNGYKVQVTIPIAPTNPITGKWQISVNGSEYTTLEYGDRSSENHVKRALILLGLDKSIDIKKSGFYEEGVRYLVYFNKMKGDQPLIKTKNNDLTGGIVGTQPTISVRSASNNQFYEPLPNEMLYNIAETPQVLVEINGMAAVCPSFKCNYSISSEKTPIIKKFTISSDKMTVELSNYTSLNLTSTKNISAEFAGSKCELTSLSLPTFECTLPKNSDNSLALVAGKHKPLVHINGIGYARYDSGLQNYTVNLELKSLSPASGSVDGGQNLTLFGSGFSIQNPKEIQVKLAGKPAEVVSAGNQKLMIVTPKTTTADTVNEIIVIINNETKTIATYTTKAAGTVTAKNVSSASPVLKTAVKLTGTGFGTDKKQIRAFLENSSNASQIYEAWVLSAKETEMEILLSGGKQGEYNLRIQKENFGNFHFSDITVIKFLYEIKLYSVSPHKGSVLGGTVLTLKGKNFSPNKQQTQVFIGHNFDNAICDVLTTSSDTVTCRTRKYMTGMRNVTVSQRLQESANLINAFEYSLDLTPNITALTKYSFSNGKEIVLNGSNLDGSKAVLELRNANGSFSFVAGSLGKSSVKFVMGGVPCGNYTGRVEIEGKGYASFDKLSLFNSELILKDVNPKEGSMGGNEFKLIGSGFSKYAEVLLDNKKCITRNITATEITAYCSFSNKNQANLSITVKDFNTKIDCESCKYYTNETSTSYVTSHNATKFSMNSSRVFIEIHGSRLHEIRHLSLISDSNSSLEVFGKTQANSSYLIAEFPSLSAGNYNLYIKSLTGFAIIESNYIKVIANFNSFTLKTQQLSLAGGLVKLSGHGFSNTPNNNSVKICGFPCKIVKSDANNLECEASPLVFEQSNKLYQFKKYNKLAPASVTAKEINDGDKLTVYGATQTPIVFDFGENLLVNLTEIRFFPALDRNVKDLNGTKFQGSNDASNWVDLFELNAHELILGWNKLHPKKTTQYRYFRFTDPNSNRKNWYLSEIEIHGTIYTSLAQNINSVECPVVVAVADTSPVVKNNSISFRQDKTASVSSISPNLGSTLGGTVLEITGSGFGSDINVVKVTIDQVPCVVSQIVDSKITCKTGKRGDSAHIPKGQNVLLDVSTPLLYTIIVEGHLMFAQDVDLHLQCHFLIVQQGRLTIGTESNPITKNVTITLHGDRPQKQLPIFGNKVIAIHKGQLDIHGIKRDVTWTMLSKTASAGATQIELLVPVDWKIGEKIAIASTDYNYNNSEVRTITAVSSDKKTITLDQALSYRHYSEVEDYNGEKFPMRCEVGLLSRNVRIEGSADSWDSKYGGHLMIHGSEEEGTVARISFVEFKYMGQQEVIGRYPIHFHRCGEMHQSYVEGNAVHHGLARLVTVHATHYLRVKRNVGYYVYGHMYFIEDGVEQFNVFEDNLAIKCRMVWTLLDTDVSAAAFWVVRPGNYYRRNHAAGGDWFGFWFELKETALGPSANPNICPVGEPIGEFIDNVAHSWMKFGLRVRKYIPRTYPCEAYRSDWEHTDPWAANPPLHSVFKNFTTFRNYDNGVFSEYLGWVTFEDFRVADNRLAGFVVRDTNFSGFARPAQIKNALVVAFSKGNSEFPTQFYSSEEVRGIVTPRTEDFLVTNVRFHNFENVRTTAFASCAFCWHKKKKIPGGVTTRFQQISYTNVTRKVFWEEQRREIYWDLDGSLTGLGRGGFLAAYWPHLLVKDYCKEDMTEVYNQSIICKDDVQIRGIIFENAYPEDIFRGMELKVLRVDKTHKDFNGTLNKSDYSTGLMIKYYPYPIAEHPSSWAFPFVTGETYHLMFQNGLDFNTLDVFPRYGWRTNDKPLILKFNYTQVRQVIEVYLFKGKKNAKQYEEQKSEFNLNTNGLSLGTYYKNNKTKELSLVIAGNDNGTLRIKAWHCKYNCTEAVGKCAPEKFERKWSNATQWPNKKTPVDGDSVEVKCGWNLKLDVDPPVLDTLTINGDFVFDDSREISKLRAKKIWVKAGRLLAGKKGVPYKNKIEIELVGEQSDPHLLIGTEVDAGNKMLAVTNTTQLFGKVPKVVWTKLVSSAAKDSTKIKVHSAEGWSVGDTIIISPSSFDFNEHETRNITAISQNEVTLDSPLKYFHYGSAGETLLENGQTIDMRTTVGLLTRNIVIKGNDQGNWGCTFLVAGVTEENPENKKEPTVRRGYVELEGVEFRNCGQRDTKKAALAFKNTEIQSSGEMSRVTSCSFHSSTGMCLWAEKSLNLTITTNVFAKCTKYGIGAYDKTDFIYIKNNLFVGINKRPNYNNDLTGLYDMVSAIDMYLTRHKAGQMDISGNVANGIEGVAFVIAGGKCGDNYGFYNNTASGSIVGFIPYVNGSDCVVFSGFKGFRNQVGTLTFWNIKSVYFQDMIYVENKLGFHVMPASKGTENELNYKNIYLAPVVRTDCPECYTEKQCSDLKGFKMPAHITSGKSLPIDKKSPLQIVSICKNAAFDSKLYLKSLLFANWNITYPSNSPWKSCNKNILHVTFSSSIDLVSTHFYTDSKCLNCQKEALFKFDTCPRSKLGWLGGCGDLLCTGLANYHITDIDGKLLGTPGQQVFPYRGGMLGKSLGCEYVSNWKGYNCKGTKIRHLAFESTASDKLDRLISPVQISNKYMTKYEINSYKEWAWDGPMPKDERRQLFQTLVVSNLTHELTWVPSPPKSMVFELQKFENNNDYIIIRAQMDDPSSIQIYANNTLIKPFYLSDNKNLNDYSQTCGANNYYFKNRTIEFVVNRQGGKCQLHYRLISAVKVTMNLEVSIADFYSNNGVASFVDKICAFLEIPTNRLRIVDVRSSSRRLIFLKKPNRNLATQKTIVDYLIDSNNTNDNASSTDINSELAPLKTKLESAVKTSTLNLNYKISNIQTNIIISPPVSSVNSTSKTSTTNNTNTNNNNNNTNNNKDTTRLIVIIVLANILGLIACFGLYAAVVCYRKKKAKTHLLTTTEHISKEVRRYSKKNEGD